jgi:hypothetical protein
MATQPDVAPDGLIRSSETGQMGYILPAWELKPLPPTGPT